MSRIFSWYGYPLSSKRKKFTCIPRLASLLNLTYLQPTMLRRISAGKYGCGFSTYVHQSELTSQWRFPAGSIAI
jgi:hypothetical protein